MPSGEGGARAMTRIDIQAEAQLIWLPKGETATEASFIGSHLQTVEEAAVHAWEVMRDHDKEPWIKTGDLVMSKHEIGQIWSGLLEMVSAPKPSSS
jgi:hypothetical protein